MGAGYKDRVRNLISIAMKASAGIMVVGTVLYETVPALLLRIFSATDEMLAIGIPAFRIIGITAIISGMTIMMSGVFPISEAVIFALSLVFLRGIYEKYLSDGNVHQKHLKVSAASGKM